MVIEDNPCVIFFVKIYAKRLSILAQIDESKYSHDGFDRMMLQEHRIVLFLKSGQHHWLEFRIILILFLSVGAKGRSDSEKSFFEVLVSLQRIRASAISCFRKEGTWMFNALSVCCVCKPEIHISFLVDRKCWSLNSWLRFWYFSRILHILKILTTGTNSKQIGSGDNVKKVKHSLVKWNVRYLSFP